MKQSISTKSRYSLMVGYIGPSGVYIEMHVLQPFYNNKHITLLLD